MASKDRAENRRNRPLRYLFIAVYCLLLFFAFDFVYSTFFFEPLEQPGTRHPVYHHDLKPAYNGYMNYGTYRTPFYTNNLGFADGSNREVSLEPDTRRILLIGDSFTQAVGLAFDQSFAGMLFRAGQARDDKIEFLNAGVASYSPVIYYQKIKYLLEEGLRFDEVVVFSDISDVWDEARGYFCIDDDPKYQDLCDAEQDDSRYGRVPVSHFVVTDRIRKLIKRMLRKRYNRDSESTALRLGRSGWIIPGQDLRVSFAPLGVEGGIARSLQNMQKLADLLKQHKIPMSIVVYPYPSVLALEIHENRQVAMWKTFCEKNCKFFIDLFPAFFAEAQKTSDWYSQLFIPGDFHFSEGGNRVVFREVAKRFF